MTAPARYTPLNPTPRTDLSQATAIEQSRAVAEVQAAVFVAQQCPRNKTIAIEEMRDATAQTSVAENAYYRYPRAGENITGVSIHLARELARCWGNIDYGVKELRRDDAKGESEMLAHAWDMQTNARASTTFIVPHVRDTKTGSKKLTETRDIYENNANAGARRLREQILAVLPKWFTEEAKANCDATLKKGNGQPIEERIASAQRNFAGIGITADRLEAKLGRPAAQWDGTDVGKLGVIFYSIRRGETTIDAEFGTAPSASEFNGVTAEDVTGAGRQRRAPAASNSGEKPDTPQVDESTATETPATKKATTKRTKRSEPQAAEPSRITAEQIQQAEPLFYRAGIGEDKRGEFVTILFGRQIADIASELTEADGEYLLEQLAELRVADAVVAQAISNTRRRRESAVEGEQLPVDGPTGGTQ